MLPQGLRLLQGRLLSGVRATRIRGRSSQISQAFLREVRLPKVQLRSSLRARRVKVARFAPRRCQARPFRALSEVAKPWQVSQVVEKVNRRVATSVRKTSPTKTFNLRVSREVRRVKASVTVKLSD
jgi:hypothetical protein